jgi:CcmD family protein
MSEWTFVGAAYAATWIVIIGYYLKLSRDARRAREHHARSTALTQGRSGR